MSSRTQAGCTMHWKNRQRRKRRCRVALGRHRTRAAQKLRLSPLLVCLRCAVRACSPVACACAHSSSCAVVALLPRHRPCIRSLPLLCSLLSALLPTMAVYAMRLTTRKGQNTIAAQHSNAGETERTKRQGVRRAESSQSIDRLDFVCLSIPLLPGLFSQSSQRASKRHVLLVVASASVRSGRVAATAIRRRHHANRRALE